MNTKYRFRIKVGYDAMGYHTIDADQLHNAYWLFRNPTKRFIFRQGQTIRGQDIIDIEPDVNGFLGWKADYKPTGNDLEEVNRVIGKLERIKTYANEVSRLLPPNSLALPLSQIIRETGGFNGLHAYAEKLKLETSSNISGLPLSLPQETRK